MAFSIKGVKALIILYGFHLSHAHYIISAYDLCLGVILLSFLHRSQCCYAFITSAPAVNLREQTAVYCSGGDRVGISNRLIPRRDNTTNITVIHQKKCLTSRVFTTLSIFHQTFQPQKVMPHTRQRCASIWMNGINGNPCCHLLLKDRILKHVTEWLIMPMCFLEVILIGAVWGKLLFLLYDQTDTLLTYITYCIYKLD